MVIVVWVSGSTLAGINQLTVALNQLKRRARLPAHQILLDAGWRIAAIKLLYAAFLIRMNGHYLCAEL